MITLAKQWLGGYLITVVLGNANRNIAGRWLQPEVNKHSKNNTVDHRFSHNKPQCF
jgi:hypothetical protein